MNQPLKRRTFLKGVGLSMGLPLLDAMLPAGGAASLAQAADATAGVTPVRMACIFFANGAIMPDWRPAGEGTEYTLSKTLAEIERHKPEFNVITGLAQDNGRAKGDGAGDHARCAASYLTGAHPVKTATDIRLGISVDQVAAEQIGHLTKLPSLELGIDGSRNAGSCDSGYSCAYSSNVSWKSETTPMAKEIIPRLAFERLFGNGDADANKERNFYRKSVLDVVAADAKRLSDQLGSNDRNKIDEYFTSVRELEQRIARSERDAQVERPQLELPDGKPSDLQQHIRLMYDLMVLAFQTDATRVATFMLANAGSNRSYKMIDVSDGHHHMSHHGNNEEKMTKIQKIDQYLAGEFGYFLDKLKSIQEGESNLLDNSMIVYGSGLSDANRHRHSDLPVLVAGRGGGTIETGRHIVYGKEAPMNNLFMSMLDRLGAEVQEFGDSTGRLKELDA